MDNPDYIAIFFDHELIWPTFAGRAWGLKRGRWHGSARPKGHEHGSVRRCEALALLVDTIQADGTARCGDARRRYYRQR